MRLIREWFGCALVSVLWMGAVAPALGQGAPSHAGRPVASAVWVEQGPVIDGAAGDPAWHAAAEGEVLLNPPGTRLADPATRFRVCTDGEWLYLLVEADDPRAAELDRTNLGRDRIDWDEALEFFIAPDPQASRYYHFAVAPGGSNYDAIESAPGTDMDFSWRHQQTITAQGWVAEVAIPLKELGLVEGVKVGDRIAFNVCRSTRGAGDAQDSRQAWSPTGGGFHNRQAMGELIIGSFQDAAAHSIAQLREQVDAVAAWSRAGGDAGVTAPVAKLVERVGVLRQEAARVRSAEQWRRMDARVSEVSHELRAVLAGNDAMVIWRVNPWDLPAADFVPGPDSPRTDRLAVEGMQGEYVTAAFGVANLSDAAVRFRVLPSAWGRVGSSERVAAAEHLTVRRVTEVTVSGGSVIRDALPQLRIEDEVTLLPGTNAVVWLTVDTHGLASGVWRSNLMLVPLLEPEKRKAIAFEARVLPAALPQGPRPYSANWANYERLPSSAFPEASYQDQRAHGTSIHFLPGHATSGLGGLAFDERGEPVNEPDFSKLDEWIDRFGEAGQLYVLRVSYPLLPKELGGRENLDDPQARKNFGWWVGKVREHFESRGMSVRDFAWYAADEPDLERAHEVRKFGTLMKAADPQQQIFVTVYQAQKLEWLKVMAPYVNLWVIKFNVSKEQRDFLLAQDARFFSYTVLANTGSPYMSYRREAMLAKAYNVEGIGFWSYDDAGRPREISTWIPPESGPSYAAIYEGQHGVVPSVRWEAWRQGIQDFRYVEWLETLAEQAGDAALASGARELAARTPQRILDSRDRTTADRCMGEVRDAIVALLVADGTLTGEQMARLNRDAPKCLTGNDTLGLYENLDAVGRYTYSTAPGTDPSATLLTDGNVQYAQGWVLFNGAPAVWSVTFDLDRPWTLSHLDFLADVNPFVPNARHFTVYLSDTGREGDWVKVDEVQLHHAPGTTELRTEAGRMREDLFIGMGLDAARARYLRLEMRTPGVARLGEVRIYGWPAE